MPNFRCALATHSSGGKLRLRISAKSSSSLKLLSGRRFCLQSSSHFRIRDSSLQKLSGSSMAIFAKYPMAPPEPTPSLPISSAASISIILKSAEVLLGTPAFRPPVFFRPGLKLVEFAPMIEFTRQLHNFVNFANSKFVPFSIRQWLCFVKHLPFRNETRKPKEIICQSINTLCRIKLSRASAEEPAAASIRDDVVKSLEPDGAIVAHPNQRETE